MRHLTSRTRSPLLLALSIALSIACSACASRPSSPEDIDAAFRSIQLDEAAIERAGRAVNRCDDACAAVEDASDAAARLCTTARELEDSDALTRCERAADRTSALFTNARAYCGCDDASAQAQPATLTAP